MLMGKSEDKNRIRAGGDVIKSDMKWTCVSEENMGDYVKWKCKNRRANPV